MKEFENFTSPIDASVWTHKQLEWAREELEFIDNALAKLEQTEFKDEREGMKLKQLLEEMKEQKAQKIALILEQIKRLEEQQLFKLRVMEGAAKLKMMDNSIITNDDPTNLSD